MAFKLYPCLPSLPCSDISPNKVGRCLLRQPMLLSQGFQIVGRVAKLKIFNHKIHHLQTTSHHRQPRARRRPSDFLAIQPSILGGLNQEK